jgi:hypothetical protein
MPKEVPIRFICALCFVSNDFAASLLGKAVDIVPFLKLICKSATHTS